jgi:hypothetical protein
MHISTQTPQQHARSHGHAWPRIQTYGLPYTSAHTHTRTLTLTYTHTHSLTHTHTYSHTLTYTHALTHTHTHLHTRTHAHTHKAAKTCDYEGAALEGKRSIRLPMSVLNGNKANEDGDCTSHLSVPMKKTNKSDCASRSP